MVSFDFYVGATYTATGGPYVTVYWGTGMDEDIDLRSGTPSFSGGGSASSPNLASQVAPYNSHSRIVAGPFTIPTGIYELAVEISSGDYSATASFDDTYVVGAVKMEVGNVATPFRKPDWGATLDLARRRYQNTFWGQPPTSAAGLQSGQYFFRRLVSGANVEGAYVALNKRMRATPAVTLYNPIAANNQVRNYTTNADCSLSAVDFIDDHGFRITCKGDSGGSAGNWLAAHYVVDARL